MEPYASPCHTPALALLGAVDPQEPGAPPPRVARHVSSYCSSFMSHRSVVYSPTQRAAVTGVPGCLFIVSLLLCRPLRPCSHRRDVSLAPADPVARKLT